jgi:hypothetical protein
MVVERMPDQEVRPVQPGDPTRLDGWGRERSKFDHVARPIIHNHRWPDLLSVVKNTNQRKKMCHYSQYD